MTRPTIDQCPDLPHDPQFPDGFASIPEGPGAVALFDGVNSVKAFARSFPWDNEDDKVNAIGWADHSPNYFASAATLREFGDALLPNQRYALNYSCNVANMFTSGRVPSYFPLAYATINPGRYKPINGPDDLPAGSFGANFVKGPAGFPGGETQPGKETTPAMAKQAAWNAMMYDIEHGSYTYHGSQPIE